MRTDRAKLLLSLNEHFDFSNEGYQHCCEDCDFSLNKEASEVLDQLSALGSSVSERVNIDKGLYSSIYVTKNIDFTEKDTHEYYDKYGT